MTGCVIVALLSAFGAPWANGVWGQSPSRDPAGKLAAIEQQLARAWVAGDRASIRRILAPDWAVIDITGTRRTRADVLEEMFSTTSHPVKSMTIDQVSVRLFGDTGVVTGRTTAQGADGRSVRLRFTDVFVHGPEGWRIVASHGTALPASDP